MTKCIDCENELDNYTKKELCEKLNTATAFDRQMTYTDSPNKSYNKYSKEDIIWLQKHLQAGNKSGDPIKYERENLTLEEQLFIRKHVADYHTVNGFTPDCLQEPIDILNRKLNPHK